MADSALATLKTCTKCGLAKPATSAYFYCNAGSPDGLRPDCKSCRSEQSHRHYIANAERYRPMRREYNHNHPEERVDWNRSWRERNGEHHRATVRARRARDPERFREYAARCRATHRERYRAYMRNYRSRVMSAPGSHTGEDEQRQYERQAGRCYWCAEMLGARYHVDHVIPLSRGGSNGPENIVIACPSCNRRKSNRMPYEFSIEVGAGRLL